MSRVKWIDGLRGAATALVAFGHFFNGEFPMIARTYWTEPLEDNQLLIQLPPLNLLWSLNAMVPLFCVISGYSIASGLIDLRDRHSEQFLNRLRSSAVRRFVRLALPLTGLAIVCQIIFYYGFFINSLPEYSALGIQPRTSPWAHARYLIAYVADSLQLFQIQYNHGLSQQMWTIPLDLRGSFIVYFTIFLQAPWPSHARLSILGLVVTHTLWYGLWDIFSILAGLSLAEISAIHNRTGYQPQILRGTASYVLRFALATYLCSLPDGIQDYPSDFQILGSLQPWKWSQYDWHNARLTWSALGMVLLFSVLMQSPRLQRMFSLQPFQYVGSLSFPIYLVHTPIYQIIRSPLRDYFWYVQEKRWYPGFQEASHSWNSFLTTYIVSGLISYSVVLLMARLYSSYLDPSVVQLSRGVDLWLNQDIRTEGKRNQ